MELPRSPARFRELRELGVLTVHHCGAGLWLEQGTVRDSVGAGLIVLPPVTPLTEHYRAASLLIESGRRGILSPIRDSESNPLPM